MSCHSIYTCRVYCILVSGWRVGNAMSQYTGFTGYALGTTMGNSHCHSFLHLNGLTPVYLHVSLDQLWVCLVTVIYTWMLSLSPVWIRSCVFQITFSSPFSLYLKTSVIVSREIPLALQQVPVLVILGVRTFFPPLVYFSCSN